MKAAKFDFSLLRFPPLALALLTLIVGGCLGLERMGWRVAGWPELIPVIQHGPLMISGFLGTLIAVERAVAIQRPWTYIGPILSALGAVALVLGFSEAAMALMAASSLMLVIVFGVIVKQHAALYTVTMALGALMWLIGNSLWLAGWPVFRVVYWWAAFLILTVAGERLELSRLLRLPPHTRWSFAGILAVLLTGLIGSSIAADIGVRVVGASYLLLAGWLLYYDIARRTIRQKGLPRYAATCLLIGYVWLAVGGVSALIFGMQYAGLRYDAMLHALLIGFILSMIFGHAPIILPALLKRPIAYVPALYAPLILLHVSMTLRFAADVMYWAVGRQWGGLLNGIAILFFMGTMLVALRRGALPQAGVAETVYPGGAVITTPEPNH
jgi:hypothetical protein